MSRIGSLAIFMIIVLGGGLAIGFMTAPGEWYAGLSKPPFNPPNLVFAPAWTTLYVLIAFAGWRTWRRDNRSAAFKFWIAQLVLNFLWSPTFFSAHQIGAAAIIVLLLLAAILGFIATSWREDRVSGWLFVPYAAWVAFASTLNISILILN